jgi:hypothetical protein
MTSLIDIPSPRMPGESPLLAVGEPRGVVETYEWGRRMVRELEAFLAFALSAGAAAVTSRRPSPELSAYPSPEAPPCC